MKLTILVDSLGLGGSERTAQLLANNLGSHLDVDLISLSADCGYATRDDVPRYSAFRGPLSMRQKLALLPLAVAKIGWRLARRAPDVVFSLNYYCHLVNVVCRQALKYQCIVSERTYPEGHYPKRHPLYGRVVLGCLARADRIIVNDVEIRESLQDTYSIAVPIDVLPNVVDPAVVSTFVSPRAAAHDTTIFISVSRLTPEKNTQDLLRALAQMRTNRALLLILGDGPERMRLEAEARRLAVTDRVRFLGQVADPFSYLRSADVFVFSSTIEGLPNAVLEAMYCGLPVISYQFKAGITSILDNGRHGILVPLYDVRSLAEQMDRLASDVPLRHQLAQKSLARAAHYSDVNAFVARFLEIVRV